MYMLPIEKEDDEYQLLMTITNINTLPLLSTTVDSSAKLGIEIILTPSYKLL